MTPAKTLSPLRLGVLISGGGTTLRNLIEKIDKGELDAEIRVVVSSRGDAPGLQFAHAAGIPTLVAERREMSLEAFCDAVFQPLRSAGVELVAMGGFLKLVPVPPDFEGRVMNIHPALIPLFCGHGYYGLRVHRAVLDSGMKVSGCTVHFVDNQYDHGPIILQRTVPVEEDDTPESLAARVFAAECEAYPDALRLFAAGRLVIEQNRVRVLPPR